MNDLIPYLVGGAVALLAALVLWLKGRQAAPGRPLAGELAGRNGNELARLQEAEATRAAAKAAKARAALVEGLAREQAAADHVAREEAEDAIDAWEREQLARPVGERLDDPADRPLGGPRRGSGEPGAGG
jgi:TPR repeat protein